MRIISSFHDYYDCLQGLDEDRKTLYIREEKEVEYQNEIFPRLYEAFIKNKKQIEVEQYTIGFCNKVYPLIITKPYVVGSCEEQYVYDFESMDKFIQSQLKKRELEIYLQNKKLRQYRPWMGGNFKTYHTSHQNSVEQFFKDYASLCDKCEDMFKECPIFVIHHERGGRNLHYNCSLKTFKFFKKFNTQQAYQELSMWFSNKAVPMKPIPVLDDVTMAESKGFDKFSFRKDKSKQFLKL